jgi:glyoxylase-like metal-dependent hydrolase (beta-lactamase superfamily II)
MVRVGKFEVTAVRDGWFALDGGAMFGIVPRVVWSRMAVPDEQNRLRLALNAILIDTGAHKILCDVGIGERPDPAFRQMYGIEKDRTLLESLARIGVRAEDVDIVVPSHLHFDHAGWCTRRAAGGGYEPAFPRATYIVQEGAWEEALSANPRTRGSYIETDFLAIEKRLRLIRGDEEIAPGVEVRQTGGHVRHHQSVIARSEGRTFLFAGDVFPTAWHVKPAWVLGFDLDPAGMAELKQRWLPEVCAGEWLVGFVHDPNVAIGYIREAAKGYRVEPVEHVS